VLVVTMLLTSVAIVGAAYFAARISTLNAAQERLGQDAQIAEEMVAERGQYASLQGDKLVVGVGNATYTLSNDTYVVDHIQAVTGDEAIIYRLAGTNLISVASTFPLPGADGHTDVPTRQVGDPLIGPARDAVLGHCGAEATGSACRGRFGGEVTLHGHSMMAGMAPLLDINGKLVGAVGVMRPLDAVLQTPMQLVILLAFVSLLVALISLGIGTWILSMRGDRAIADLGERLETMAGSASELQQLVQLQAERLQRQERAVRQVSELARELDPLVGTMEREQVSLRQSATDIWAEMSQPGLAPNPATALQLARQSAVAAARVGATSAEVRTRSRLLLDLMMKIVAEGHALTEEGQEAEQHTRELLAAIEGVETTLGDQSAQHSASLRQRGGDANPPAAPSEITGAGQSLGRASSGRHRAPRGGMHLHRPSPGQKRTSGMHPLYGSGQGPAVRPDSTVPPSGQPPQGNRRPGQGNAPRPPAGGQRNDGRSAPGPGMPPQARPPRGDDSQPGGNSSNSRWLND
jgi:hypothetical protein